MHDDPLTPPEDQFKRPPRPGDSSSQGQSGSPSNRHIPPPLQNWQVLEPLTEDAASSKAENIVEIEGEASVVDVLESDQANPDRAEETAAESATETATIADRQDRLIGLGLDERRYGVEPGDKATLQVDLLNNGPAPALFEVKLEGWIDESWAPDLPVRIHLPPGERRTLQVVLTLPVGSVTRAGEYAFAVTAQTARYAGHMARVGAVLAIARHTAFHLGSPQPRRIQTSWFRRSALVHVPLHNQSNHAVRLALRGVAPSRQAQATHFTYYSPQSVSSLRDDEDLDGVGRPNEGIFHVEPGASFVVPVRVEPAERPWIGLFPQVTSYRMVARLLDEPAQRRSVEGQIGLSPLIGPWQMGIAALLALVAVVGMGLTGLALLLALRSPSSAAPVAAAVGNEAATPAPPAVFVIQLEQPAPTRTSGDSLPSGQPPAVGAPVDSSAQTPSNDGAFSVPIAPVVRADQVTAPGEPTRSGQAPLQPLEGSVAPGTGAVIIATPTAVVIGAPAPAQSAPEVAPRSSAPSGMTYGEMFREVGLRYDWDWRLLAAQAYVESGFDSLALSGQGDMGLMQIRPPTWQEWAPQVAATDPFDSYSNVLVAARYLDYLRTLLSERGYPQQEWTLVAYNWGPDEVLSYLAGGGTWESLDAGLRSYAEDIQRIAQTIPSD